MAQSDIHLESEGSRNQPEFNVQLNAGLRYKEVAYLLGISAKIEQKHSVYPCKNPLSKLRNPTSILAVPESNSQGPFVFLDPSHLRSLHAGLESNRLVVLYSSQSSLELCKSSS